MVKFGVVSVFTLLTCSRADGDPCQVTNHVTLNDPWRSINNNIKPSETAYCDSTMSGTWYRVESHILGEIATAPPSEYSCGTRYPIWMGDVFPGPDQTRAAKMCFSTNFNTCESPWTIDVKNCVTFYVYQLTSPSTCPSAYCFNPATTSDPSSNTVADSTDTTTTESNTDNDDTLLAGVIPSVIVAAILIIIIVAVCIRKRKGSSNEVYSIRYQTDPNPEGKLVIRRIVDNQQPSNQGNQGERGPPPPGFFSDKW